MSNQSNYVGWLNIVGIIGLIVIFFMFFLAVLFASAPANMQVCSSEWCKSNNLAVWIGLLPAIVSAGATVFYAYMFFRLQKEIDDFNRNISRDNRLIEISTQWNSLDFVRARNRTYLTIKDYKGNKSELYRKFMDPDYWEKWVDISLIAHFVERLGRLLADGQVDINRANAEFGDNIVWWCDYIQPVFEGIETEKGLVNAIEKARILLEGNQRKLVPAA